MADDISIETDKLRKMHPKALIAFVNNYGLAAISKLDDLALDRIGWNNNSIIAKLYELNANTGLWRPISYSGTYTPTELLQINTYELSTRLTEARLDHLDADLNDLLTQVTVSAGVLNDVWDSVNHKLKVVV